jgi:hypothetical protein
LEEYSLELYKNSANTNAPKPEFSEFKTRPVFKKSLDLPKISELPDEHFAKTYVRSRQIPEAMFSNLYYAEEFKDLVDSFNVEKDLIKGDKRLVIPFHDKEGNITGFQGRALGQSKLRYITIKLLDEGPRMFGMDRVDENEMIYVFEGPIDSMFIKNSVAVASSSLQSASEYFDKSKLVLVYDNEPRNKEIVNLMEKSIDNHFNVVIWPAMIEEKDVNDMVLTGFDIDGLHDIMEKHTFVNLRAKMEFVNWKKV